MFKKIGYLIQLNLFKFKILLFIFVKNLNDKKSTVSKRLLKHLNIKILFFFVVNEISKKSNFFFIRFVFI